MNNLIIDMVGWVGAAVYLVAYILVSIKRLEGDSVSYQVMNLIGGILLIVNTAFYGAYPAVALNTVWALVALYFLFQEFKR